MVSEAPPFWWKERDWRPYALWPFSRIYAAAARHRLQNAPRRRIDLPVLCIGNLTVGGAGKTPVAIALAGHARRLGLRPGFLSRGYGGSVSGTHLVNPHHDRAGYVGDEPLLLAAHAPVAVSTDRMAGVSLLMGEGCDFIIMDDGFQSARLHMDYALIVVDGERGIGNGHVIPGGPMRADLVDQMRHLTGLLKMGAGDGAERVVRHAARAGRPIYRAHLEPRGNSALAGHRCFAFAGIGNPKKFYDTVAALGGEVARTRSFPDHHSYAGDEADELVADAQKDGLVLVTTTKDAVRLRHGGPQLERLHARLQVVEVDVVFEADAAPAAILEETLAAWRRRRLEDGLPVD